MKLGPVVQEMSLKEKINGRTLDGWTKTNHIGSPKAFGSGELLTSRNSVDPEDHFSDAPFSQLLTIPT